MTNQNEEIKTKRKKKKTKLHTFSNETDFHYCDNGECADFSCERWIKHAPFDEIVRVIRHELDKNGHCKYRL